ncbi:Ubiquitin-conjugating enzyme E2 R2, partial [Armadillidium vulgare]
PVCVDCAPKPKESNSPQIQIKAIEFSDVVHMDVVDVKTAHMKFPPDYPYSPPSVRFLTKVWHPNVYENGDLCISILHPPVDDPHSGELPCERWNPTQSVRTVLLSVISLLNEPNTYSPANVDASVMYRRFRDSKGKDKEYENIIR